MTERQNTMIGLRASPEWKALAEAVELLRRLIEGRAGARDDARAFLAAQESEWTQELDEEALQIHADLFGASRRAHEEKP